MRDAGPADAAPVEDAAPPSDAEVADAGVPTSTIPLTVIRLDDGSGMVRVSNGVLLRAGQLSPDAIDDVRVMLEGDEISVYVEALQGRHPDGSVVSLLLQLDATLDPGTVLSAELQLDSPPSMPRLPRTSTRTTDPDDLPAIGREPWRNGYPAAVAMPDIEHLLATRALGEAVSASDVSAMGGRWEVWESRFERFSDLHWDDTPTPDRGYTHPSAYVNARIDNTSFAGRDLSDPSEGPSDGEAYYRWRVAVGYPQGNDYFGHNYYDGAAIHLLAWARTGMSKYLRRGLTLAWHYGSQWLNKGHYYGSQPNRYSPEGLLYHYWLTGDEETLTATLGLARSIADRQGARHGDFDHYWGEPRPLFKFGLAYLQAWRSGDESRDWAALLRGWLDNVLNGTSNMGDGTWRHSPRSDDPCVPDDAVPWSSFYNSFMMPMVIDAIIRYWEYFDQDDRIPLQVQSTADFLFPGQWGSSWDGSRDGVSSFLQGFGRGNCDSDDWRQSYDLTNMYPFMYAWLYRRGFGDEYRTTADTIFEAGVFSDDIEPRSAPPYLYGTKQFNEQYRWAPFYFAYRR